ncbi:hypothetical protein [Peribacillus sp. NPDC096540]|uniref:hypothetical protein n=1 Tax=Peribacillus sp. NPDC096540 TaxID=3390612 RepID=UPI003D070D7A
MAINLPYGITIPMVIVLDYNAMTGYAMVCFGAMAGFLTSITNPCNVGVAQGNADLPLFSGMGLRIALFVVLYICTVFYIFRHANKVKKNLSIGTYGAFTSHI